MKNGIRRGGNSNPARVEVLQGSGQHRGRLIGGRLKAVDWLRGTLVWPEPSVWRNSVLLPEISEDPGGLMAIKAAPPGPAAWS
jgi:hypothetical protein